MSTIFKTPSPSNLLTPKMVRDDAHADLVNVLYWRRTKRHEWVPFGSGIVRLVEQFDVTLPFYAGHLGYPSTQKTCTATCQLLHHPKSKQYAALVDCIDVNKNGFMTSHNSKTGTGKHKNINLYNAKSATDPRMPVLLKLSKTYANDVLSKMDTDASMGLPWPDQIANMNVKQLDSIAANPLHYKYLENIKSKPVLKSPLKSLKK